MSNKLLNEIAARTPVSKLMRHLTECYEYIGTNMRREQPQDIYRVQRLCGDAYLTIVCMLIKNGVSYIKFNDIRKSQIVQKNARTLIEKEHDLAIDYGMEKGLNDIKVVYDKYLKHCKKLDDQTAIRVISVLEANVQYIFLAADIHSTSLTDEFKNAVMRRVV